MDILNKVKKSLSIYTHILNVNFNHYFSYFKISFNLLIIQKILKYLLNISLVIISLFFVMVLYVVVPIIPLVICLFFLLIFCNLLIYYNYGLLNVNSSFLNKILTKDYTYIIQKIVIIKFIFFYLYVCNDFAYCDSSFNRIASDLFISMGSKVGFEQKTTVSTLETLGMCAVVGGVVYGSIKGYQMFTNTTPKSVEQRLSEKIDLLNNKINNVQINVNKVIENQHVLSNQLENTKQTLINVSSDIQKQNIDNLLALGSVVLTIDKKVEKIEQSTVNLTSMIENNQTQLNFIIKNELNSQLTKIEEIHNKHKIIVDRNLDNLTEADKSELSNLYNEFEVLMQKSTTLSEKLPETVKSTPIVEYLPSPLSSLPFLRQGAFQRLDNTLNRYKQEDSKSLRKSHSLDLDDDDLLEEPLTSMSSLAVNKTFKLTELTDTKLVFTSIGSEVTNTATTLINPFVKRVFHGISSEVIINVAYTGLKQVLSNSMSGITFIEILKILGIGSKTPHVPTTSENVGKIISSTLKDFLGGVSEGWKKNK